MQKASFRPLYLYDPAVGRRFIPNIKTRVPHADGSYFVRTNSNGFRNNFDFIKERTKDVRRILLFGDSFTAGEGVSNGSRFSDALINIIPNIEIYNYGMPATGTDQQYLIYKTYADNVDHDLVLLCVFVENIRRVASHYRHFLDESGKQALYAKPYFTLQNGSLILHCVPPPKKPVAIEQLTDAERHYVFKHERLPAAKAMFRMLLKSRFFYDLFFKAGLRDFLLTLARYQPITEYADERGPAWQVMRAIIMQWISQHSKPVMLMPIPLYHYIAQIADPSQYQDRLREATETAGGHFFDPTEVLAKYSPAERRTFYFETDGHLTSRGHAELAKIMAGPVAEALDGTSATRLP